MVDEAQSLESPVEKERLLSLDLMRGLMVIAMMMVDWCGNEEIRYRVFFHSQWTGITAPDFIYPCFMFLAGVAIPYSLQSRKSTGASSASLYAKIFRRSALLFLAGYFINICWYSSPTVFPIDFRTMRLLGILQRYALVYPIVAILYLNLPMRKLIQIGMIVLLAYWVLLALVPVPGYGVPNLAIHPEGELAPNLATWFDKTFLGKLADCYPYDSEGILSNLPPIATVIIGVASGEWLRRSDLSKHDRANRLFVWGVALVIAGYFWGQAFPLCKKLWTSSFVLFTGGWNLLGLAALFWLVDIQRKRGRWMTIPRDYGMNALGAILIYTFIECVTSRLPVGHHADHSVYSLKNFINDHLFRFWLSEKNASWAYSIFAILALSLLFRWFRKRQIFIKA